MATTVNTVSTSDADATLSVFMLRHHVGNTRTNLFTYLEQVPTTF